MSKLSPSQLEIIELADQGFTTVSAIAAKLGKTEGIVRAQLTRIRTAGEGCQIVKIRDDCAPAPKKTPSAGEETPFRVPQSNQDAIREAAKTDANYKVPPNLAEQFQQRFGGKTDVHPMVLLGVTIQFTKLAGGRLSAHQLIEDVYDALRTMVGEGSPPEWVNPTSTLEQENEELRRRIAELEKQATSKPTHT
jgi:hypothetical protein